MTIRDMHYDFKSKLNKLDSSQYRNLKIPEIDRNLNEALDILLKTIVYPRVAIKSGLEMTIRNITDIAPLIVENFSMTPTSFTPNSYTATLPANYKFPLKFYAIATKENCKEKRCEIILREHSENHEVSPLDVSSFEWREVNAHFYQNNIRLFTDTTFTIDDVVMDYIRKPLYMHNAQDFGVGTYTLPDGTSLTLSQDCELHENIHPEIVDLAVLITSGQINTQDFQLKQFKMQLNQ